DFTAVDHIRDLHKHYMHPFTDTPLVNTQVSSADHMHPEIYDEYLVQAAHDFHGLRNEGCREISPDLLELKDGGVVHDGDKV
ncbi:hypothetical protein KYX90_13800, partial [Enterococcus lactis]|nr:hypothetical protein [Enterococcus lactis]